jgi:release factor glutamine methyltransferase
MSNSRKLTTYEKNHLRKFGFDLEEIDQHGEKPVEYITGKTIFLAQEFIVDQRVLIPRIETEQLVELIKQDLLNKQLPTQEILSIIEIGTGSGVIGLSLAKFLQEQQQPAKLILTDIDPAALAVAKKNFSQLFPHPQELIELELIESDLLVNLPNFKADLIVANLPYIPTERLSELDESVRNFEPKSALDGGKNGWQYIGELLNQVPNYLKSNGKIYLEIDDTHTQQQLTNLVEGYQVKVLSDQFDKNRFATLELT